MCCRGRALPISTIGACAVRNFATATEDVRSSSGRNGAMRPCPTSDPNRTSTLRRSPACNLAHRGELGPKAQTPDGAARGVAVDATGAGLPGAIVRLLVAPALCGGCASRLTGNRSNSSVAFSITAIAKPDGIMPPKFVSIAGFEISVIREHSFASAVGCTRSEAGRGHHGGGVYDFLG